MSHSGSNETKLEGVRRNEDGNTPKPTRTVGAVPGRVTALVDCDAYIARWINLELPRSLDGVSVELNP